MALLISVAGAQDYQISFAISDDSETIIDSVVIRNIEQGKVISLKGNDILHLLASPTGISDFSIANNGIEFYPNPFPGKASMMFQNHKQGLIKLSLFDIGGKTIAQRSQYQSAGKTYVELEGLGMGAYVIQIVTETSVFSKVVLSDYTSGNSPGFIFKGVGDAASLADYSLKSTSEANEMVDMQYNAGDTLLCTAYFDGFCSEQRIVPDASTSISFRFPINKEDMIATAEITIDGGVLQLSDEAGNIIKLSFPPGAVMDTTTVSLTLLGEHKDLPIHERKLRPFEIRPTELSLYRPVEISIEYNSAIDEIEDAALFQMRSDSLLTPLGEHIYDDDNRTLKAETLILGDFVEGKLTYEQVNAQFDLLVSYLGISWGTTLKSTEQTSQPVSNGDLQKYIWDESWGNAMAILKLRDMRRKGKPDDEPPDEGPTLEEEIEIICKTVLHDGLQEILDLGLPDDPCDRNYTHTLTKMMRDMNVLGCVKGDDFERLTEKFEEMLVNCHSFLSIVSDLNIEAGGLTVNSQGVALIFTTSSDSNTGTVEGSGSLAVSGGSNVQGSCTSIVSGTTQVEVSGTRDATFSLCFNPEDQPGCHADNSLPRCNQ